MADRQLPPPEDDQPFLAEGGEGRGSAFEGASTRPAWRRLAAGGLAATLLAAVVLAAACAAGPARRSAPAEGRRGALRLFEDIFDDPRPARDIFNDPRQLNDPADDGDASAEGVRDIDPSKIFKFSSRNSDGGDGKPTGDAAAVVPKAADAAAAAKGTADDVSALGSGAVDVETPEAAKEFNLSAPDPESCAAYGCEGYDPARGCQCDPTCGEHRSCCYDYNIFCKTTTTRTTTPRVRSAPPLPGRGSSGGGHDDYFSDGGEVHGAAGHAPQEHHHHEHHSQEGSCAEMGCFAEFQSGKPCQCNPYCDKFDSCCHDYDDVCTSDGSEGNHHSHHHDDDDHHHHHHHEEKPARAHGPATCANYGCGGDFVKSQECQCNSDCEKYDSCCPDYSRHCDKLDGHGHHHEDKSSSHSEDQSSSHSSPGSAGHGPATCKNYGCGGEYVKSQGCQCNSNCEEYDTCCPDYARQCGGARHKHHSGSGKSAESTKRHEDGYAGSRTLGQHEKKKAPKKNAEHGSGPPDGTQDPDNNCKNFGCQDDFIPELSCQCAPSCHQYHSCCWDYMDVCPES